MFGLFKSKSRQCEGGESPLRSPKPKMLHRILGSPSCLSPAPPKPPSPRASPIESADILASRDSEIHLLSSPKRQREEGAEVTVGIGASSPAIKAPRLSRSPQRQLRKRSGAPSSPVADLTPPGITAVMKQVRKDKVKKKRIWDAYFNSTSTRQPCPACSHMINTTDYNFEIQQMIPRGFGADDAADDWNMFPLCSNVPEDSDDEDGGWGCSELLEREQCVAVEQLEDDPLPLSADEECASSNALDWLILNYPHRVHEILIRLQRAHGEVFGMPAGESLCLRFARDVYQFGKSQNHIKSSRDGEWIRKKLGFRSDIVDLAECMKGNTDIEVLRRVELKDTLTPKKSHPNRHVARTPLLQHPTELSNPAVGPQNFTELPFPPKSAADNPLKTNENIPPSTDLARSEFY